MTTCAANKCLARFPSYNWTWARKQTKKKTRSHRRPQTKGWRSLRSSDLASVILNMTLCRSEIPTSMSSSIPNSSPIAATENKLDSDVSRSRCMHTHNRACLAQITKNITEKPPSLVFIQLLLLLTVLFISMTNINRRYTIFQVTIKGWRNMGVGNEGI